MTPFSLSFSFTLAGSGYREILLRGVQITVYCLMDTSPARTFLDLKATSFWSGAPSHVVPFFNVTISWSKAEMFVSSCLVFLKRRDRTFAQLDKDPGSRRWRAYNFAQSKDNPALSNAQFPC